MPTINTRIPYNDLPPLPPVGVDLETTTVLKKLVHARSALAEVKQGIARIPNPAILINSIGLREAQLSSEIENIVTTSDELFRAFSDDGERTDPQTKEVLRYREALAFGLSELRKGRPIATRMFEDIVRIIRQTDEGIRRVSGTTISNKQTNEIIYTPPVGEAILREKLSQLEQFMYGKDSLDPLIKLALVHYQFEAIHPFTDGNGRTGRIIMLLYLIELGLISLPVLFLSRYILEHRNEYYVGLRGVTVDGQWEEWILYILEVVQSAATDSLKRIDDICSLQNRVAETLQKSLPKIYSLDLVQVLFEQPYTRIKFLESAQIAKRQAASRYLDEISKTGILKPLEIGREKYFVNTALLEILKRR